MGVVFWVTMCVAALAASTTCTDYSSDPGIEAFRNYIRINTTSGNDMTPAVEFWQNFADEENVTLSIYEFEEGYPVLVMYWPGTDSSLPSVWLNSHMDVVPADEEDGWTYPPFDADMDDDGNIYGRGTQDMKSVSMQYFLAMRQLKAENVTLLRDVYLTFMPDEEIGGEYGMQSFLDSDAFTAMNAGVEMDEGSSFPMAYMPMFYQDKVVWQFQIDCYGQGGHGSTFPATNSTATGECVNVLNRMFELRDEQYAVYEAVTILNAGNYSSINANVLKDKLCINVCQNTNCSAGGRSCCPATQARKRPSAGHRVSLWYLVSKLLEAGTTNNVIPSYMSIIFDVRPATNVNADNFFAQVNELLEESGSNITLTYILKNEQSGATVINSTNPYWVALDSAAQQLNITVLTVVAPGSTDARFIRNKGIPCFGFSPLANTELLLHSVNEYVNAETFLNGIKIYKGFISSLANIPGDDTSTVPFTYVVKTAE